MKTLYRGNLFSKKHGNTIGMCNLHATRAQLSRTEQAEIKSTILGNHFGRMTVFSPRQYLFHSFIRKIFLTDKQFPRHRKGKRFSTPYSFMNGIARFNQRFGVLDNLRKKTTTTNHHKKTFKTRF